MGRGNYRVRRHTHLTLYQPLNQVYVKKMLLLIVNDTMRHGQPLHMVYELLICHNRINYQYGIEIWLLRLLSKNGQTQFTPPKC
jgi:hypothetical protein